MSNLRELPIGIQDFNKLISNNYLYIDKTKYLHSLITKGSVYFLSRPRRFGKSLLVATLEAIFLNKKELFKGLYIAEESDYVWQEYPVIKLSMGKLDSRNLEVFEQDLNSKLAYIAKQYDLSIDLTISPQRNLEMLISKMHEIGPVTVLIDEYDKPILDNILKLEYAEQMIDILRGFYGVLKEEDAKLKFVFLTGVSKLAKTSVFSGLNNPEDITMSDDYASMLGISEAEIDKYFVPYIEIMAKHIEQNYAELRSKLRTWYNGYRMSKKASPADSVYNPYSLLSAMSAKDIRGFWFATGTPSILIEVIRERQFDLVQLEHLQAPESAFDKFEIDNIAVLPLLYQTGYLTIAGYREDLNFYQFRFPNREVNLAFTQTLLNQFCAKQSAMCDLKLADMLTDFIADEFAGFMEQFNELLEFIPYDLYLKQENIIIVYFS